MFFKSFSLAAFIMVIGTVLVGIINYAQTVTFSPFEKIMLAFFAIWGFVAFMMFLQRPSTRL